MVIGWRRAFCTSIPRDRDSPVIKEKREQSNSADPSPRQGNKFGFFSNPSTPRLQSQPVSSPSLRCRTTATVPSQSAPGSPRLHCRTKITPKFFHRSTPSSPRSPSTFSLLKSSLRTPGSRCGICLQSVKTGQGTAIFTAECSHSFHFPCIAAQVKKQGGLVCAVCGSHWKELPVMACTPKKDSPAIGEKKTELSPPLDSKAKNDQKHSARSALKVYNDDEPLLSPTTGARFNPIPESDENEDEEKVNNNVVEEFQGFFTNANANSVAEIQKNSRTVEAKLLPEAAIVSVGRSHETYSMVLKVRAPPAPAKKGRRAPIDLVTVLDVSEKMTAEKLQMTKRAMRLVVSSLSSFDRLSIVAFSGTSKRLLPLKRMTPNGRLSARRIIDALVACQGTSSVNDALKKAAKVLEDRRDRNAVASIILLSDGQDGRVPATKSSNTKRQASVVHCTRFAHLEIPVYSVGFNQGGINSQSASDDSLAKCIGGLLNVVVEDLRLQLGIVSGSAPAEISAVYSFTGRPAVLGSGSIRLGDLHAEEEREVLVELKVPSSAIGAHHVLSVRCSYKDPSTQQLIHPKEQALLVPHPQTVRSSVPGIERLRSLFIATRAVAESRRLIERSDLAGAQHMLSSARALLMQSRSASADEFVRTLDAELAELQWRRQVQIQQIERQRVSGTERDVGQVDEKGEQITPTSAWRAAERLAKVAIMKKSMNRVSDLHGFENARF